MLFRSVLVFDVELVSFVSLLLLLLLLLLALTDVVVVSYRSCLGGATSVGKIRSCAKRHLPVKAEFRKFGKSIAKIRNVDGIPSLAERKYFFC